MKYFAICDETTCKFTKNFIFSYRIIDRITEFSFIIFFRFYTFYGAFYFVYSRLSSIIFSPLPIIYCILLSVCHFFSNKPVRAQVQFLVISNFDPQKYNFGLNICLVFYKQSLLSIFVFILLLILFILKISKVSDHLSFGPNYIFEC